MAGGYDVLIVGSGHGGAQAAIALRQLGFQGRLGMVTEETDLPYERPALSKSYLAGDKAFERILLRSPTFWADEHIDVLSGRRVVRVDSQSRRVFDQEGEDIEFDKLIWAAGGRARQLTCDGADLQGVYGIRRRSDVDELARDLEHVKRVVIIGAGYIGLEVAAVLTKLDKSVTILEAEGRVLSRVAGEPLSRYYEAEHRAHGVDLRLGVSVGCILGVNSRAAGVRIGDGSVVPADVVIVGIGITPSVHPLLEAGAEGMNGVDVDAYCRTTLPGIYAVGDCAAHINAFASGRRIRLESVQNASDQASCAARHIVGKGEPYSAVPWFWSNQYDLRLQTIGLSSGYAEIVVRGDPASRSFSVIYMREGRVLALDCVNAPRDFIQGKALVADRAVVPGRLLADVRTPLKELTGSNRPSDAGI